MLSFFGWMLLAIGIIGFAVELQDLFAGTSSDAIVGFVLASLFSSGGLALLLKARRRKAEKKLPKKPDPKLIEPEIFRLAANMGGRISAVEVSAKMNQPFDVANRVLVDLAQRGACQVLVTDQGATIYRFPEFEGSKRDLLEE